MNRWLHQHDAHCIIRSRGEDWRIVRVSGDAVSLCNVLWPTETAVINLGDDIAARYADEATKRLQLLSWPYDIEAMADEIISACDLPPRCRGTLYAALSDAYRMGRRKISYDALKKLQAQEREAWAKANPNDDMVI